MIIRNKYKDLQSNYVAELNLAMSSLPKQFPFRFQDFMFLKTALIFPHDTTGTPEQKYTQKIEADLIVFGILVDNIERNKVAYRESINPYTKKMY